MKLGQRAYHAYGNAIGWVNFMGESMPDWDKLPPSIQSAWQATAMDIANLGYNSGAPDNQIDNPPYLPPNR